MNGQIKDIKKIVKDGIQSEKVYFCSKVYQHR